MSDGNLDLPALRHARELVDDTLLTMRLLCDSPEGCQAEQFRREVAQILAEAPEIALTAELLLKRERQLRDAQIEDPELCPRCKGTGKFKVTLRNRRIASTHVDGLFLCGCPAGERWAGNEVRTTDQLLHPERYASAGEQLSLIPGAAVVAFPAPKAKEDLGPWDMKAAFDDLVAVKKRRCL